MKYTFISEQTDPNKTVCVTINDDVETWGPPMDAFFSFLKANGFIFDMDDHIGVMNYTTEEFRGAEDFT